MKTLLTMLVLVGVASAADFQSVKILDVAPGSRPGPNLITTNPSNGYGTAIPITYDTFTITVPLDGLDVSASYYAGRHFKSSDFIVGDSISAKLDGNKLILRDKQNKEHKGAVVRRAHPTSASAAK